MASDQLDTQPWSCSAEPRTIEFAILSFMPAVILFLAKAIFACYHGPASAFALRNKMPLFFNTLLREIGIEPSEVALVRHQDSRADRGRTPYGLWREDPAVFDEYQTVQNIIRKLPTRRAYWASFVGLPDGGTLFVGLYRARFIGVLEEDRPRTQAIGTDLAGTLNQFDLQPDQRLDEFVGKLLIEWGKGERAIFQKPEEHNKPIIELRKADQYPPFPGALNLILQLSEVMSLPPLWIEVLKNLSGVYLLTCPRTKEQYVGSAGGAEGFYQRWANYALTGHGGNIELKSREPSDYQVSILEVAGSADVVTDLETHWKRKLQSREMGLNRN